MWIVDLVFRPLMLAYNFSLWNAIRRVQADGLCPGGDERIVFFGDFNASLANTACEVGWAFCLVAQTSAVEGRSGVRFASMVSTLSGSPRMGLFLGPNLSMDLLDF